MLYIVREKGSLLKLYVSFVALFGWRDWACVTQSCYAIVDGEKADHLDFFCRTHTSKSEHFGTKEIDEFCAIVIYTYTDSRRRVSIMLMVLTKLLFRKN